MSDKASRFSGKVAVVTGSTRGIGKAIAQRLAAEGASVVVSGTNAALADEVAGQIKAEGGQATAITANLGNPDEVKGLVDKTIAEFKQVDILVNNAGIARDNLLMRMSEAEWDDVLDVNLKAMFLAIKAVARPMMKKRSGRIINLTSVVGFSGNPGQANYSSAKAGIMGLTKSAAKELASRGITVNAVAPGFVETDMTGSLPDDVKASFLDNIPLGRAASSEDIAGAVSFLASDDASYITGQVIHVNGGLYV